MKQNAAMNSNDSNESKTGHSDLACTVGALHIVIVLIKMVHADSFNAASLI